MCRLLSSPSRPLNTRQQRYSAFLATKNRTLKKQNSSEPRSSHSRIERSLLCRRLLLELVGGGNYLGLTADVEWLRLGLKLRVERHVRVRDDGRHEDHETDVVDSIVEGVLDEDARHDDDTDLAAGPRDGHREGGRDLSERVAQQVEKEGVDRREEEYDECEARVLGDVLGHLRALIDDEEPDQEHGHRRERRVKEQDERREAVVGRVAH